jgi:membrane-associated phospholipid phosphatase
VRFDDEERIHGFTFGGRVEGPFTDPIVQCLVFIAIVSAIFVALPGIDAWFTDLFHLDGDGFPMSRLGAFTALREVGRRSTAVVPTVLVAVLLYKVARPDRRILIPPAKIVFMLSSLAIGSGIVANLVFKANWGRPRPGNVDLFGGTLPFVPAWRITDYCPANCSFISGEASSAFWLLGLAALVPAVWRPTALRWLAVLAVLISFNRIAFGGHFLSDVLLGWGFTALVMVVIYRFTVEQPLPWVANARLEADLTRLGHWVRRRLGLANGPVARITDFSDGGDLP